MQPPRSILPALPGSSGSYLAEPSHDCTTPGLILSVIRAINNTAPLSLCSFRAQLVASIFDAFPTAQLSTPTDAPAIFDRGQTGPISIAPLDIAPWIIDVSFNDTLEWNTPGGGLLIYLANPTNPSRSPFKGPWRLAAWFDGSAIPSSPQSFEPTITADREITTGERISCKAVALYPDGRTASPTYATAIAP